MATEVLDVDLADGPRPIQLPAPYRSAQVLIRWRGRPLGQVRMDAATGRIASREFWLAATAAAGERLPRAALADFMPMEVPAGPLPSGSVVVCTRDRPEDLRRSLDSIGPAAGRDVEVIVVDNAPPDDRTERLARAYPVRYVCEPRPGLNWARSRGALEANGEIVLYTDDDVVVDRGWVDALRRPFDDPRVGCVTGLVMPMELETEAQEQFERFVGFGRGFDRRELSAAIIAPVASSRAGAGASMAFRRELVVRHGLFDVPLDCGTAARSGGDHYAFYRLLAMGHVIVYEPEALSWHRHRRGLDELRSQLFDYSIGVNCWLLQALVAHGEGQAVLTSASWFIGHHLGELWSGLLRRPGAQPLRLTIAEIRGVLVAPLAFLASRREAKAWSRPVPPCPRAKPGGGTCHLA